jgi:hypothetical protein
VARNILVKEERKELCKKGHSLVFVPKQNRLRCYQCDKERSKKYYNKNRDGIKVKARDRQLRYLYGITKIQYEKLLFDQNYCCKICDKHSSEGYLFVDHSHSTGEVRGLLCRSCNFILGQANDSKEILRRAMEYLK